MRTVDCSPEIEFFRAVLNGPTSAVVPEKLEGASFCGCFFAVEMRIVFQNVRDLCFRPRDTRFFDVLKKLLDVKLVEFVNWGVVVF